MSNLEKFKKFREEYPEFIFSKYEIDEDLEMYLIKYLFEIPGLCSFSPSIVIDKKFVNNKNIDKNFFNMLVFHIGMVEAISYFKCTCSPLITIKCGFLDSEQIKWFKKLYYNGLGEFLYTNGIDISEEEFFDIKCLGKDISISNVNYEGCGNLIPVGGGKDSIVTLELLKNEENNSCFIMNPKDVTVLCSEIAGYSDSDIITIKRNLDRKIVDINNEGFLNGHTPLSSLIAFISYLVAYLNGKRYIVLSNEASSNEASVVGTSINHQYSKSYEFERDFNNYTVKYFKVEIKYFSLLRPLSDFCIAKMFSNFKKYHHAFKSCNLGSKNKEWCWCLNCSKCLFTYIILSPFLSHEEMVGIFSLDLYEKRDLLNYFLELLGMGDNKPFECVGTYDEVKYAVSLAILKYEDENLELPYLLKYYKDNYPLFMDGSDSISFNEVHNLDSHFENIVREAFDKYV